MITRARSAFLKPYRLGKTLAVVSAALLPLLIDSAICGFFFVQYLAARRDISHLWPSWLRNLIGAIRWSILVPGLMSKFPHFFGAIDNAALVIHSWIACRGMLAISSISIAVWLLPWLLCHLHTQVVWPSSRGIIAVLCPKTQHSRSATPELPYLASNNLFLQMIENHHNKDAKKCFSLLKY